MTALKNQGVPDAGHALHLLRRMLRVRRLEEKCIELYSAAKIRGFMCISARKPWRPG